MNYLVAEAEMAARGFRWGQGSEDREFCQIVANSFLDRLADESKLFAQDVKRKASAVKKRQRRRKGR